MFLRPCCFHCSYLIESITLFLTHNYSSHTSENIQISSRNQWEIVGNQWEHTNFQLELMGTYLFLVGTSGNILISSGNQLELVGNQWEHKNFYWGSCGNLLISCGNYQWEIVGNYLLGTYKFPIGNNLISSGNQWESSGNILITSGNQWETSGNIQISSGNQ